MSKQDKKYNGIPESSSLYVAPLKKGEIKKFRLLDVYNQKTKKYSLRTQFLKNEETVSDKDGNLYDIAAIDTISANGTVSFLPILFLDDEASTITVRGGSIKDRKIYERLAISSYNKSNLSRDTDVTPLFEEIDLETEADNEMKSRKKVRRALEVVDAMDDAAVKDFMQTNYIALGDAKFNRNQVERFAEANPGKVLKSKGSDPGATELIKKLKKDGVINYNIETKSWTHYEGKKIMEVTKAYGADPVAELNLFLLSNPAVMKEVKTYSLPSEEATKVVDSEANTVSPSKPKPSGKQKQSKKG